MNMKKHIFIVLRAQLVVGPRTIFIGSLFIFWCALVGDTLVIILQHLMLWLVIDVPLIHDYLIIRLINFVVSGINRWVGNVLFSSFIIGLLEIVYLEYNSVSDGTKTNEE